MLTRISTGEKFRYSEAERRKEMGGAPKKSTSKQKRSTPPGLSLPSLSALGTPLGGKLSLPSPDEIGPLSPAIITPRETTALKSMKDLGLLDMAHNKQDPARELQRQQDVVTKVNTTQRLEEMKKNMEGHPVGLAADTVVNFPRNVVNAAQGKKTYGYLDRLNAVKDELQKRHDQEFYQDLQNRTAELESVRQAPDFKYTTAKARNGVGWGDVPQGRNYKRLNSAVTYLAAEEAGRRGDERYGGFDPQQVTSVLDNAYKFGQMTDGEKNTFLYYIGRKEYDKADDYLDALQRTLNARASGKFEQAAAKLAQDAPALGVLANVGTWPLNIPALFANAGQAVKNAVTGEYEPTDTNSDAFLGTKLQRGTGTGVQEAARSRFGDAGAFLAGTGLSMGQNLAQMPLGPVGALAGMSASAAGSSTLDALERGASPGEALALGGISGGLEAITEKLPLDQLFRIAKEGGRQTAKEAVQNFIKHMGTEATEEAISEVAGNIADTAMLGGRSEYQRYVEELKAQGLNEQEARQKAFQQFYLINTGLAAAGGALSGGVMGAGAQVVGNLNYRGNVQQGIGGLSPRERTEIVNQGLKCDPKSKAYKLAVQAVNKSAAGGEVSDGELAKIFLEVERQIEREAGTTGAARAGRPGSVGRGA